MRDDFAAFILTHGRADNVITYNTLRKQGYTGKIILLIDNEDAQINDYKRKYGDEVFIFDKQKAIDITDSGDNFKKRNSVVYARNYNFVVAKELGYKYFLQLDDDYSAFRYTFDNYRNYITRSILIKNLDNIIEYMLEFYIDSGAKTIAMSQGGDFIGGEGSKVASLEREGKFSRKVMNSFFCSTDRPFKFAGRINEDVNAYTELGNKGDLFITVPRIRLEQIQTQANSGGLTDIYLDLGTYIKSFYSVMYSPSCVKINEMGVSNKRLHHMVKWKYTCPQVISADYRK
tara:strand:+ start:594 stop:1457 length:864 start_codon:yes stop_codon:yes gene_type:complete